MNMTGNTSRMQRSNKIYGWLRRRFAEMHSKRTKGLKRSPEMRARMSAARLGKKLGPHSAETKAKMSAASKGRKKSPEHAAKIALRSMGNKYRLGKPMTEYTKQRLQEGMAASEYLKSDEYRAKQSQDMKRIWAERKLKREGT